MTETPSSPTQPSPGPQLLGQPRGLATLFFTEMWERFSYYGMRGLLVFFMTATVMKGGMNLTKETAYAIYGLYTAAVYLASLPGGWLADRLLGAQNAVWYGGIIIALGHFIMAIPSDRTFFLGLVLVAAGTGMLKPNISAIVAGLYPEGGTRRDAGFTIFYMGINFGATLGPFVCGTLGEKFNWHYGFGAAGVGMVLGLIQFRLTRRHLSGAGLLPGHPDKLGTRGRIGLACCVAALVSIVGLCLGGAITINPVLVAKWTTLFIVGVGAVYFGYIFLFFGLDAVEKRRVGVILILFLSSALFWSGFEQAGSSLNIFAKRYTMRTAGYDFTTFSTNDIVNMPGLFAKLSRQSDPVSKFAWEGMTNKATQKAFAAYQSDPSANAKRAQDFLLIELDNLIDGDPIYEAQRFAGVALSPPTEALLKEQQELQLKHKHLQEEKQVRFNRLLLEDAYRSELSQNQTRSISFVVPASWLQSVGPIFVIVFAPVMAGIWVQLGRRNLDPSIPIKFGFGLLLLALGFAVMAGACVFVAAGEKVLPTWLIMTYLIHTFGELCLSPVGLSSVTKLSPKRLVGQMMGTWFLATSLGNLLAGLVAGEFDESSLQSWPTLYLKIVIMPTIAGLILLIFAKPIKKLMAGVK